MSGLEDAAKEVAGMLYEKGDACDFGVDESLLPDMIELARSRHQKKIRAVKSWKWWDYDVSEELRAKYAEIGLQPAIVFADYLIWDSSGQWEEGWNAKSSKLVSFEENCLFVTRNTVYILVGPGHRKTVNPNAADSIYF